MNVNVKSFEDAINQSSPDTDRWVYDPLIPRSSQMKLGVSGNGGEWRVFTITEVLPSEILTARPAVHGLCEYPDCTTMGPTAGYSKSQPHQSFA